MEVLKLKPSVWWLLVCVVVLHVGASDGDDVDNSGSQPTGYYFEILLDQIGTLSVSLKSMADKLQSVEVKLNNMNDNLQSVGNKLHSAEGKLESVESAVQSMNDSVRSVDGKIVSVENKVQLMSDNLRSVDGKILSVENKVQLMSDNLRSVDGKFQTVENKVQSMNDNLDNKFQSMNDSVRSVDGKILSVESQVQSLNDNLHSVDKKWQTSDSKLLKIENDIQEQRISQKQIVAELKDHQSDQKQNQKEVISAVQKLERQVAYNSSEEHNRNEQNVQTVLHKLDEDVDNVHNMTRQIMNALPQLCPTSVVSQRQDCVTPTDKSVATTTTPKPNQQAFSSCKAVPSKVSGTYLIRVNSDREPFKVYCEQEAHGGGWIVFQYRYDGSVDFYRGWDEFREGFGDLNKEFWLGLEKVHQITSGRKHELIVEMKDFSGNYKYARYDGFEIGSESDQYDVKDMGEYSGTAGNAVPFNKGRKFSTKDRDNDGLNNRHCAQYHESAWWHRACTSTNLNGRYKHADSTVSMFWFYFYNYQGLSYSRMMIRELE